MGRRGRGRGQALSEHGVRIEQADGDVAGASASFPYDASLVERFRVAFPRARWRDDRRSWFVPGSTAARRLHRWLGRELSGVLAHADDRGRDAFAFDPIESPYLVADRELVVRTPYSKTAIDELRAVPWAWWDGDERVWRVPFRSVDELRKRWPAIEAAALRNEPAERRRRREEFKDTPEHARVKAVSGERRRRRYPVPAEMLPPLDRVVFSHEGAAVFVEVAGEIVDPAVARDFHSWTMATALDLVWAQWRRPTLEELIKAWPARRPADEEDRARGWWHPTLDELREARRQAKSRERATASRRANGILKVGDGP